MASTTGATLVHTPSAPAAPPVLAQSRAARRLWGNPLTAAGLVVLGGLVLIAVLAPVLAPLDPNAIDLSRRLRPPGPGGVLGTDALGRDLLSRMIWGAQLSLQIGAVVVLLAGATGFLLGAVAGYVRGAAEVVLLRVIDILLAFPPLVLAMAIASFLGPDLQNAILAIAIVHMPKYARLARGEARVLRERLFVQAAQTIGVPPWRIILRHVMPNAFPSLLVVATLDFGLAIMTAASLGFLGLGAQQPAAEWGVMVADGRKFLLDAPWLATFPGLAIMAVVIAANVFGDGLRDWLDPRLRSR